MTNANDSLTDVRAGLLDVGTTELYHELRGRGRAVLMVPGGGGDAGLWTHAAEALTRDFTVVTYDRRGFSRSPRPAGWNRTSVEEHADDAAGLLRTLELAPAAVVGHSSGAAIACSLVVRHPDVVRHAVVYEPPLLAALPTGQEIAAGLRAGAADAMTTGGPQAAMERFMRVNGGDEAFAAIDPATRSRVLGNGEVFFSIEMPAFSAFVPDCEQLRSSTVCITVVSGEANREHWFGAIARWLADATGADHVELPGGHVGFHTHPQAFVDLVRRLAA